jgi:hypothetical protein
VIRNLTDAACDFQMGRYAHSQIRQWATNMSSSDGVTTLDVQVWQYQRWRATNNSGREITITEPIEGPARTDRIYRPGQIDEPLKRLPTDPGLLWAQFDRIQPEENGPQSVLRAWSDLNVWFSPNRAQRAAALTVFSDTDALTWHGATRDQAGRPGIGLSVISDNGGTRDLLILDPATGELLAYELTALRDPGALGITEPTVLDYHLFLAHTHTATTR